MSKEKKTSAEISNRKIRLLAFRVYEAKLRSLFLQVTESSFEALLIKGWVSVRDYEDLTMRGPGDVDLLLPSEVRSEDIHPLSEITDLPIDFHFGPRHLDTLTFYELYERSETIDLEGVPIRVPCPEDHLRILCVHWLTDGGERKERLWDIYWAVMNRPETFNWNKCLDVVSRRRQRWIICTIGLAHKYLDLPIDDLPFAEEARDLPKWLTKAVESRWKKGVGHIPIHRVLGDRKAFWGQVRKRFPPNPVMATIGLEGDFDAPTRIHYQLGFVFKQAGPSIKRVWEVLRLRRQAWKNT